MTPKPLPIWADHSLIDAGQRDLAIRIENKDLLEGNVTITELCQDMDAQSSMSLWNALQINKYFPGSIEISNKCDCFICETWA